MIKIFRNGKVDSGASYDGEKMPGDLSSMDTYSRDANGLVSNSYDTLSKRSMTLYHSYGPAKAAVNKQVEYAIGPGLMFRSQPDYSSIPNMTRETAKEFGKNWQKIVHYYYEKFNFYEKQSVLFRGALTSGDSLEFFIRENGNLVDIIDMAGNQIDSDYDDELTDGQGFTLGVKHDKYLRPKGIMKTDGVEILFKTKAGSTQLIQFFIKDLPSQLRGYPLVYSVINLAKNDDRHNDATVQRAVLESILVGSFETESSNPAAQTANLAKTAKAYKAGGGLTAPPEGIFNKIANAFKMGPGNIFTFKKGEKLNFNDLKTPSPNFAPFKEAIINYIAAGTGTPPEVILSRYSTSFTAHKGALNDFIKSFMLKRKAFARRVMMPTNVEIAKQAIKDGLISMPGFFDSPIIQSAYMQGNFLGPITGTINPIQELRADKIAVEEGFKQRGDVAAQYGNEWDNHINEWHEQENEWWEGNPAKAIFDKENGGETV